LRLPRNRGYDRSVDDASERRQEPRVSIDAFVRAGGSGREYVFRTRDVSTGGLFLFTRVGHIYPFKIGDSLRIELYDYDQFVVCKAVVVRVVRDGTPEAGRFPLGFNHDAEFALFVDGQARNLSNLPQVGGQRARFLVRCRMPSGHADSIQQT